jgi:hypothetical protein
MWLEAPVSAFHLRKPGESTIEMREVAEWNEVAEAAVLLEGRER